MNTLFAEIDTISGLKQTTRSDRIKESISKLSELAEKLDTNRKPLHNMLTEAYKLSEQVGCLR